MKIFSALLLFWLVVNTVVGQQRSLPGKPDERCWVPGEIQRFPQTGCTNDVINCGWTGEISQINTFYWILYKNVCPEGKVLGDSETCVPGKCFPKPYDPCDVRFTTTAYEPDRKCTPYYMYCGPRNLWTPRRCKPGHIWNNTINGCMSENGVYPIICKDYPPKKENVRYGEPCEFYDDFQKSPHLRCGPFVTFCDWSFGGRLKWKHAERPCPEDKILTDFNMCTRKKCRR